MIDIPYNNTVEVHDTNVAYVRAQFDQAIKELEKLTGKKFDQEKFDQARATPTAPPAPGCASVTTCSTSPLPTPASTCSTTWPTS